MEPLKTQMQEAAALNAKVVSLPRLQLLRILEYFHPDGIEFRELQSAMNMSDGKLLSNLYALRDFGYLRPEEVKVENKTLTIYNLSPSGLAEWQRTRHWLIKWLG